MGGGASKLRVKNIISKLRPRNIIIQNKEHFIYLDELLDGGWAADELHPGEHVDSAGQQDREAPAVQHWTNEAFDGEPISATLAQLELGINPGGLSNSLYRLPLLKRQLFIFSFEPVNVQCFLLI